MPKSLGSNQEWKAWGDTDPMYGVATWSGKDKDSEKPWTPEEFYRVGESDWNDFAPKWINYGLDTSCCVEIGCGAGRISKFLSKTFNNVHCLDVSEGMINTAKKYVDCSNIQFILYDGNEIPLPSSSVSAAFSCHVFQHLDSLDVATQCFIELHRVMSSGSTFMIHLPVYKWPSRMTNLEYLYRARKKISDIVASTKRGLYRMGMADRLTIMRGLWFTDDFLFDFLPTIGFSNIEIRWFPLSSNNDPHLFVFGTKS